MSVGMAEKMKNRTGLIGRWSQTLGIGRSAQSQDYASLPICSFGPGGSYLVDWQADADTEVYSRGHARTLASGIGRFMELLAFDLKGWLLAEHPDRLHRVDSAPVTLDGCPYCGHENQWPMWFIKGQPTPDYRAISAGIRIAEDLRQELASDSVLVAAVEQARTKRTFDSPEHISESFEPIVPHAGFNIASAISMAEVKKDITDKTADRHDGVMKTPSQLQRGTLRGEEQKTHETATPVADDQGNIQHEAEVINYADGAWETENTGPFLFKFSDNLEPVSFRLHNATKEHVHDADTKTTQNTHSDTGLSGTKRLLANHAGTGRSAQRIKSHNLRARRGARAERPSASCPEQGSLFGDQPDGQAA